jgi:hypothetical protein
MMGETEIEYETIRIGGALLMIALPGIEKNRLKLLAK